MPEPKGKKVKSEDKKVTVKSNSKNNSKRKTKYRIVFSFLLFAIALFLFLAFSSFLFTAKADQSKLQIEWYKLVTDSDIKVENVTGKSGAWIADVFINRWFGVSAFGIVYLLFLYGLWIFNRKVKNLFLKTFKAILVMIWLSIALGFAFSGFYKSTSLLPGGGYGYHVSMFLNALIGKIGTLFILIITLGTYLLFVSDRALEFITKKREIKDVDGLEGDTIKVADLVSKNGKKSAVSKLFAEDDDEDFYNDEPEQAINRKKTPNNIGPIGLDKKPQDIAFEKTNTVKEEPKVNTPPIQIQEIKDPTGPDMTVEIQDDFHEEYENMPMEEYDPTLDLSHYQYPSIDLLEDYSHMKVEVTEEELIENKNKIVDTLKNFKIDIVKIKATIGPTVTLYEIIPAQGIRISKIKNLEDDIALSLSALGIRIIAPIPGRGTIGIEVPNRTPQMVSMRSIIGSKKFQEYTGELPIALGRTISNEIFTFDLTKTPHMLVAGATGQGKSVGLNAIIVSLLYKKHPSQLKFVFIDPKKVELNLYASIERHFLAKLPDTDEPIITDVEKVKATLNSVGIEMDARYDLLKVAGARNIKEYNKKFISRKLNPDKGHRYLPYIVVVVDEFADLIMTAGKEVELPIARIAQLARAVGIHMIIATQRPSTNIITGVIKANFPTRVALRWHR
jgi:DNA segregation ATPase FtsK/SpoIIIE, S-DNA-T family